MEINSLSNINLQVPYEGTKLNQTKGFVQNDMASSDLGVIYTHGTEEKFTTYTRPSEVSPASLSTSEVQTC
ncbi:MAG: hypothetical protein ACI4EN_03965 [Butyrivibrio sp.]